MRTVLPARLRAVITLLAVAVLAAGCGSGTSASSAAPAAGGTPGSEAPTPHSSRTPSSDVQGSTDLTSWMTQVCISARDTLLADDLKPDLSKITKDPQAAAQKMAASYARLGDKMISLADQLEQIGAPDIPNGKQFVDAYVDTMHQLGALFNKVAASIPTDATSPQQVFGGLQKLDTGELQKLTKRLQSSYQLINTPELEELAKSIPECKELSFGE